MREEPLQIVQPQGSGRSRPSFKQEISDHKFPVLARIANDIPLPKIFGTFESDALYLKTVDLLIKSTQETRNRIFYFLTKILPQLTRRGRVLDIGPGGGQLIRWVGRHFDEVTLLDPVQQVLDKITPSFFPKDIKINKIPLSFSQYEKQGDCFDLIILSHVLYHFDYGQWIDIVKKSISCLSPGGILVIVVNAGLDRQTIATHFGGRLYSIDNFLDNIRTLGKETDIQSLTESFRAGDLRTMLHICGLHLHDFGGHADQENLTAYIEKNYFFGNSVYRMEVHQHFITVRNEPYTDNPSEDHR